MRRVTFFSTMQGFSVAMLIGATSICILFGVFLSLYDADARGSFGIPERYVTQIMSAYTPVVGGTLVGFRNVLFETFVSIGAPKRRLIPIRSGVGLLYGIAILGLVFAALALILVSTGIPETRAKWFIGIGATVWAVTLGSVFERFFKQFAKAPTDSDAANP